MKHAEAGVEDFALALAELSERHYGRSGSDLLKSLKKDPLARKQYARLFGVVAKQPFTVEVKRQKSLRTKSVPSSVRYAAGRESAALLRRGAFDDFSFRN
jgi:hypothetical protein